jgi:O-antigen/teichoic acid export membrane protein
MLGKALLGYMPVQLAQALASFGGVWVFTRLLGADAYGQYALLVSVMALAHTATLTWSEAAAYRFHAKAEAEGQLPDHYRSVLVLWALACVPAVVLIGLAWLVAAHAPAYRPGLAVLLVVLPLAGLVTVSLETHRAAQRVGSYVALELPRVVVGFGLGVVLAAFSDLGAAAPLVGLAGGTALAAGMALPGLLARGRGGRFGPARGRMHFAFGWPVAAALLLDLALSAGDRFVIAALLGEAAVGAYAAGYGVADKTLVVMAMWATMAAVPAMLLAWEQKAHADFEAHARRFFGLMIAILLPAAAGLALVARPLAEVMIGPELREAAASVLPLIAVAGVFNGLQHYFAEAFQLTRRTGVRAGLMAIPAVANIGLNLVLIPQFGLMGAVAATLSCYVLLIALYWGVGRRFVALPVDGGMVVRVGLAVTAMAVCVSLVPAWGGIGELLAKAAVGAVVYGAVAWRFDLGGLRSLIKG